MCWLGDSRAYWLAGPPAATGPNDTIDISGGSQRLTRDDSLAEEIVAAGLATMDEAMASPQAHVITRWLGADLPGGGGRAQVEAAVAEREAELGRASTRAEREAIVVAGGTVALNPAASVHPRFVVSIPYSAALPVFVTPGGK